MATKTVTGRIQHKHDVEANWKNATNFIPKAGELIVYDPDSTHSYARFKIGDGTHKINELTFAVLPSGKDGSNNGSDGIVVGEGTATGTHSVAGGSTDKSMVTSLLGSVAGALVNLEPANAQAVGSLSFGASTDSVAAGAMSIGVNSIAGCLGYYISAIDFTNKKITLSTTQKYKYGGSTTKPSNLTWATGDVISIFYNTGYYECSKITAVDKTNGIITVDSLPITTFELNSNTLTASYNPHDISVYVPQKPTSGEVQLGFAAYARGYGNKALGVMSNAIGYNNIAVDTAAFVTGRENVGSFGSLVGGYNNKALKENSFAVGRDNNAIANYSGVIGVGNTASGRASFASGSDTFSYSACGHTEGFETQAGVTPDNPEISASDTSCAHAEGNRAKAYALASHAEGLRTCALGTAAHSEGNRSKAEGAASHAEGYAFNGHEIYFSEFYVGFHTTDFFDEPKIGDLVEIKTFGGSEYTQVTISSVDVETHYDEEEPHYTYNFTYSSGDNSANGEIERMRKVYRNYSKGIGSHTEGYGNEALANNTHVEGYANVANYANQHVQGKWNKPGNFAHIIGGGSASHRSNIHTVDWAGNAWFRGDVLIGESEERLATESYADMSVQNFADSVQFLELVHSYAPGQFYNSGEVFNDYESNYTEANFSHVEGSQNIIYVGNASHAEGYQNYIYGGTGAHVEGYHNEVYTTGSHAEGYSTHAGPTDAERDEFGWWTAGGAKTDKSCAHAEGNKTRALGLASHAEGISTSAIANYSHAEGRYTESHGEASHAEGYYTKTGAIRGQHVQGRWNDRNELSGYAHIVGWGTEAEPKNIHTLGTSGDAWFAGSIYVGGTSKTDTNAKRLPVVHSGTTEPSNSLGQDGDIYIMY